MDGEISIDSAMKDFSEILTLPIKLNIPELNELFCDTTSKENISTFQITSRTGLMTSPDDLQR